ncbi:cache domain-containing sensor histidine kinase [Paenibacillus sp. y28]|uniref:cache domain-containing sensor histidine kinase n=1 Tax=Paenibacillus sp. y28 TaxID=3129110 RepID=UPI0030177DA1
MLQRLQQWISRVPLPSFRFKLIATAVACVLIPTCITLAASSVLTKDAVKEQAVLSAESSLQLVNGYVSNTLKAMLHIMNFVQLDSEISTALKQRAVGKTYSGPEAEYQRYADTYRITSRIDSSTFVGEKLYITILQPDGQYYTNYMAEEFNPLVIFQESWFADLKQLSGLETYWVGLQPTWFKFEKARNPYQLSLARTLRDSSSNIYAYVIVTMMENQINSIFKQLASGQELMLLDAQGTIISHPDPHRMGQPFTVNSHDEKDVIRKPGALFTVNGREVLLSEQSVLNSGWKLVMLTPYKEAVFKINRIFNHVFLLQLLAFVTFMLLLVYLLRAYTKPLTRLSKLAETVQRGNLEARSHLRGKDEIGRLGLSFDQMLNQIKRMIAEVTLEQSRKRKAELAMLQAQIHPHFLFNVLNSIRMKVLRRGDQESSDMISSLSRLLRMTIDRDHENIPLHEELEIVMHYLQLMNMRQKETVHLRIDASSGAQLAAVPRFMLQPLIENALIHGFNQHSGTITLQAFIDEQLYLKVVVEDDGQGMNEADLEKLRLSVAAALAAPAPDMHMRQPSDHAGLQPDAGPAAEPAAEPAVPSMRKGFSGVGLANVAERLRLTFGETAEMNINSEVGIGTRIRLRIPYQEVWQLHV